MINHLMFLAGLLTLLWIAWEQKDIRLLSVLLVMAVVYLTCVILLRKHNG